MQALRNVRDQQSAVRTESSEASGILEDTEGVVWLFARGRRVGRVSLVLACGESPLHFDSIVWDHVVALRLLQGETVPNVTGLMLTAGTHRSPWHPEPGVDRPIFQPVDAGLPF